MNVTKLVLTMFALSLLTLTACGKEEKDDVKSAFPEEPFVLQVQEGTLHGSMMYPADKIIEAVVILVPDQDLRIAMGTTLRLKETII